jgi:hypothetical protein
VEVFIGSVANTCDILLRLLNSSDPVRQVSLDLLCVSAYSAAAPPLQAMVRANLRVYVTRAIIGGVFEIEATKMVRAPMRVRFVEPDGPGHAGLP